jgi:hypothetical protein
MSIDMCSSLVRSEMEQGNSPAPQSHLTKIPAMSTDVRGSRKEQSRFTPSLDQTKLIEMVLIGFGLVPGNLGRN